MRGDLAMINLATQEWIRRARGSRTASRSSVLRMLHTDRRGLSTLEYALLFVVILVGALAVWKKLAASMDTQVREGLVQFARIGGQNAESSTAAPAINSAKPPYVQTGDSSDTPNTPGAPGQNDLFTEQGGSSTSDPPVLQKKHVATLKPDPDDGGTYDLWLTCNDGVAQACMNLEQANAAELKKALTFIQRVAPDLYDPKNPPKFKWDSSDEFFADSDGATQGTTITLARGYYSERVFVNTVAHELQHAQQSSADAWLTWGQDKVSTIMGDSGVGAKHQAIVDRALEIEELWAEEHP